MTYLFRFSISPVQSFIEQARKAQDLFAGSHILSELAKAAAAEAQKQGISLVFPQLSAEAKSFPNRFTGILADPFSQQDLQAKGQAIEDKVRDVFKDKAEDALEKAGHKDNPPDGFWNQIENHLDLNWLFYAFENGNDYQKAFVESDQLMTALKNTRFISNPNPEAGRKCSLDGERNALFFGQGSNESYINKNNAVVVTKGAWLNKNEGLSAVSLMKRAYDAAQSFPSTAKVALQKQMDELEQAKPGLLECYEKLFGKEYPAACAQFLINGDLDKISTENKNSTWLFNFDEQLLYEENLTDKNIPNPTQLEVAKTIQQKLKPYLSHKYYALICFDVDKMGELLAGSDAEAQKKISEKLMAFSGYIYDKKDLRVVYAGGDDFLGFVNLKDIFEVVRTLRTTFDEQVSKALGEDVTFSMGIAIAHYKTPLHIVLQTARAMQKNAKAEDKGNRNAVAIKVLKHSGEGHETYFKWGLENGLPKWNALQQLTEHLLEGCSDTFIQSLEREFLPLQDGDGNVKNKQDFRDEYEEVQGQLVKIPQKVNMLQTELLRLAARSLKEGKKHQAPALRDSIWTLFEETDKITHKEVALKNALEALKIAIFIHRKTKAKT
ncbi:MAG: type III-B CRISPR-associated protein Cas10/Cmr2 [Saprospiraceae bacterium]|nr:type III-B CRISPR-associated protein Cas10/Cmr2 [Saprospiraceae bacterium]